MTEIYSNAGSRSYVSAKKIKEMQKKALQSYKKISTIKAKSDKEKNASSVKAEQELDNFIQDL